MCLPISVQVKEHRSDIEAKVYYHTEMLYQFHNHHREKCTQQKQRALKKPSQNGSGFFQILTHLTVSFLQSRRFFQPASYVVFLLVWQSGVTHAFLHEILQLRKMGTIHFARQAGVLVTDGCRHSDHFTCHA